MIKKYSFFSKALHLALHPQQNTSDINSLAIFVTFVLRIQEVELIKPLDLFQPNDMITIYQLISNIFVVNMLTENQKILVIIGIFVLNVFLSVLFALFLNDSQSHRKSQFILNLTLNLYSQLAIVPVLYISLEFITQPSICNLSDMCSDSTKIAVILICCINIGYNLVIVMICTYFGRADRLMDDNKFLIGNYNIMVQILLKCLLITTIVLKIYQVLPLLRLIILTIKWIIEYILIIRNVKPSNIKESVSQVLAFSIGVTIILELTLYDLCLISSFIVLFTYQVHNRLIDMYITIDKQENIITAQIMEYANECNYQIVMSIIKQKHACVKCRNPSQVVQCLLRKMANDNPSNCRLTVLYCSYLTNTPLKALIRLMFANTRNSIYYSSATLNITEYMDSKCKAYQLDICIKNQTKQREHSQVLDLRTVYDTYHSAAQLFPHFIESINLKIEFWKRLIAGCQYIQQSINSSLLTTDKMLQCKKIIEEKYDVIQFKLVNAELSDIITIKLLQIYYSAIYANSFQSYALEKAGEDLLRGERFKQFETLDNIQFIQNRVTILKSSLVRRRGELIQLHAKHLSKFMNVPEDDIRQIKHVNQLLPPFIASIHDKLMENYLRRGHSKLMINGESTFYQGINGFIVPCTIQLYNFYEGNSDYILNMIITRENSAGDSILFGVDGKILGMTQGFYEESIKSTMSQFTKNLTIQDLINKGGMIQYYIPQITQQVQEFRDQIITNQNYQLNNLSSTWNYPSNHQECLNSTSLLLSSFKKKNNVGTSTYKSYKSVTISRMSQTSLQHTIQNEYDEQALPESIRKDINIDQIPIIMLHQDLKESMQTLNNASESFSHKHTQMQISYTLQYAALHYKLGCLSYFIVNIKDYKQMQVGSQYNCLQTHFSHDQSQQQSVPQSINTDIQSENPISDDQLIQEIRNMVTLNKQAQIEQFDKLKKELEQTPYNSQLMDSSNLKQAYNESQLQMAKSSNRSHINDTNRFGGGQALFIQPKMQIQRRDEMDQLEKEIRQICDANNKEQFQFDLEEIDIAKNESNSEKGIKVSVNIVDKIRQTQLRNKQEQIIDFNSNQSKLSTTSTSKESLLIVQQLYHNTRTIIPLKKIAFLLFLICAGILSSNIINVNLIDQNLYQQTQQVITLRKPQNINYFYTSVYFQLFYLELIEQQAVSVSPLIYSWNIKIMKDMYDYYRTVMVPLSIEVPIKASSLGYPSYQLKLLQDNRVVVQNTSLQEFYIIINERFEILYRQSLVNESDFTPLYQKGIIRQNIVEIIHFHNILIEQIMQNTIDTQASVKDYFLSIMLAELFAIVAFVALQLRYWLFLDNVTKSIILLISRMNETQAIEQITRLQSVKDSIMDDSSNQWKLSNYGNLMFDVYDNKMKKQIDVITGLTGQQQSYKSNTALYSRIQQLNYNNPINIIITFVIILIWTGYLMGGYLLHMDNNNRFQPSLVVTLKFVQFRQNFDSAVLLGGLIKTEPLLFNQQYDFIDQSQIIQEFSDLSARLLPTINEVMQVILETANANNQKSRFDTLLNDDLCLSSPLELIMCNPENLSLPYNPGDQYQNQISNGVLGYTAAFIKYIKQEFSFETDQMAYQTDIEELNSLAQSGDFQNFFLQYFLDIQSTMRKFLVLFQEDNTSIAMEILKSIQTYYFGLGFSLFLILTFVSVYWVYQAQQKINSLRQILVLIPVDQILTSNIRSQAKQIHNWLY